MEPDALLIIASNVAGWLVLAGIGWNRLSNVEDQIERNNDLIQEQNSRIDKLELWRARVEGKKEGIAQEKNRQMEGEPNRKLQG